VLPGDAHAACPSTAGLPADTTYTLGPVPEGGVTVSHLFAQIDAAAAGSGNLVSVLDNGTAVFSCTITVGNTTCTNSGSVAVIAGHYLQVRITKNTGAADRKYRVSFGY
jgi:hypothetical protein